MSKFCKILEYSNYCNNLFSVLTVCFFSFIFRNKCRLSERTFANLQTVVLTLSDSYDNQLKYSKKLSREKESQPGAELEDQLVQRLSCKPCLTEKK